MIDNNRSRAVRASQAASALLAVSLAFGAIPAAHAQALMRSPTINLGGRAPSISSVNAGPRVSVQTTVIRTPSVNTATRATNLSATATATRAPRLNATATATTRTPTLSAGTAVRPILPYAHYSPNLYPTCTAAERDDGECLASASDEGGSGGSARKGRRANGRRNATQTAAAVNLRTIPAELVAEIDGALSDAQADELARRHGLARIGSQNFPLIGATMGLFRITDRRSLDTARRELAADASVRSVQPNFRYLLQDQKAALSEGDPAQYALVKLRLPEAHTLAHGTDVRVAVIDSGIDAAHPELAGSIVDPYDALGSKEGPHVHGTGIAGAIVSHARLMGGAPTARIVAIRAFGTVSGAAESNSYVVLKAMDYAAVQKVQIVNMSFAGPKDPLIERAVAALAGRGIVLVAAAGNAGPKSPPLYPAANPGVIAVSATDEHDRLLPQSNRGGYVSVAAPGVEIFLPAPDGKYQMTSGTSFSAAYVSALAALMLERNPATKPDDLRAILMKTARDLGSPGRDDLFGAGEADAFAAVQAVTPVAAVPTAAAVSEPPQTGNARQDAEMPAIRAANPPIAAMASDKPGSGETNRPAPQ